MTCSTVKDWKNNIGNFVINGIDRDYYDCGKYYFDGRYNVVEFPAGMSVYHGSVNLAMANVELPLNDFYSKAPHYTEAQRSKLRKSTDSEDHKKAVEDIFDNAPVNGWFGHYQLAHYYASVEGSHGPAQGRYCGKSCVFAYKLHRNIKLILMSDSFNIASIISNETLSEDEHKAMITDYNFDPQQAKVNGLYDPRDRVELPFMITSSRTTGYLTPKALCRIAKLYKYDGFGHFRTPQFGLGGHSGTRNAEIVTCNPKAIFIRDTNNPLDWQHNRHIVPKGMKEIIKTMKQYHTSNVDFHGGSPYNHSLWTALWTEYQILNNSRWWNQAQYIAKNHSANAYLAKLEWLSVISAFMHDIGKFGDDVKWFYDKPKHPSVGSKYLLGQTKFVMHNGKSVNLYKLLRDDGYDEEDIKYMAWIAAAHYDFGNTLKNNDLTEKGAEAFLETVCRRMSEFDMYYQSDIHMILVILSLINISVADVRSTKPPSNLYNFSAVESIINEGNVRDEAIPKIEWNLTSRYHPFLSNITQQTRGKEAYEGFKYPELGMELYMSIQSFINMLTGSHLGGTRMIEYYGLSVVDHLN